MPSVLYQRSVVDKTPTFIHSAEAKEPIAMQTVNNTKQSSKKSKPGDAAAGLLRAHLTHKQLKRRSSLYIIMPSTG